MIYMKKIIDLIIAVVALIILLPLIILIGIMVKIKLGSPIFFRQVRIGLNGKPFILIKFRSMSNARDDKGNLLPDELRLTRFGRLLRSTSLDELPEILNVLKGEMSLVGPRPLLPEYMELYNDEQKRRHEVKPGITGWAQVNGRNSTSWEERLKMDVWYVDNWSIWLDIKILFMTVIQVISRRGINADGCATMPKFTGRS